MSDFQRPFTSKFIGLIMPCNNFVKMTKQRDRKLRGDNDFMDVEVLVAI